MWDWGIEKSYRHCFWKRFCYIIKSLSIKSALLLSIAWRMTPFPSISSYNAVFIKLFPDPIEFLIKIFEWNLDIFYPYVQK